MKYRERSHRRSIRSPKSGAGPASNRCRTVIIVLPATMMLSYLTLGQKGARGMSLALLL